MSELPPGAVAYRRTPVFTETTVPAGLRRRHRTRAGVWATITVVAGELRLSRLDPPSESVLDAQTPALIAPEEPHAVEPLGPVRFFLDFWTVPAGAEPGP